MKIAFLTYNRDPSIPTIDNDGNPITVKNYSYWLAKFGHKIDIYVNRVTPNGTSNDYIKSKFLVQTEDVLEMFPGVKVLRNNVQDLTAKDFFQETNTQEIPEIIQSIISANNFDKHQLDNYDLVCIFHPLASFGVIFRDLVPLNKLILFPMLLSDEYKKFGAVSPIYVRLEQVALQKIAKIFSPSSGEKEVLIARGIDHRKIKLIHRGIEGDIFKYHHKIAPDLNELIRLVTVGSIRPQKRQHILIEVVNQLKQKGIKTELFIIGENRLFTKQEYEDYYKYLQAEVSKYNLENQVKFAGGVNQLEVAKFLDTSHIAIFPSTSESFGKAALESICTGTPTLLAKECSAYKDFSQDEGNSLFVDSGDAKNITGGILKLLEDKMLYSKLSSGGFQTGKRFTWQAVTQDLDEELKNQ